MYATQIFKYLISLSIYMRTGLEKRLKLKPLSFLKRGVAATLLASSLVFGASSCSDDPTSPPSRVEPKNKAPDTEIFHEFGNEGEVKYTFSGSDPDGSINYIVVRINKGSSSNVDNNSSMLVDIIKGNNSVEATAYDNKALADSTPAEYSFVSPTESQADSIISEYLGRHSSSYENFEENVLLSLGASEGFYVDFLITKDDGTNAAINYIGYEKDLEEELNNQEMLNMFGIPSLYIVKVPGQEIKSRLDAFRNNGFN